MGQGGNEAYCVYHFETILLFFFPKLCQYPSHMVEGHKHADNRLAQVELDRAVTEFMDFANANLEYLSFRQRTLLRDTIGLCSFLSSNEKTGKRASQSRIQENMVEIAAEFDARPKEDLPADFDQRFERLLATFGGITSIGCTADGTRGGPGKWVER